MVTVAARTQVDIIPESKTSATIIPDSCSVIDLAHRAGLPTANALYYTALMMASRQAGTEKKFNTTSNPLGKVQRLLSPHKVLSPPPFGLLAETTYTLGLTRGQLPGKALVISDNLE